jgi:hypothetical protein
MKKSAIANDKDESEHQDITLLGLRPYRDILRRGTSPCTDTFAPKHRKDLQYHTLSDTFDCALMYALLLQLPDRASQWE